MVLDSVLAASVVAALVSVALFVVKHWLKERADVQRSAVTLSLYAEILVRALERNVGRRPVPIGIREVLDAGRDALGEESAAILMASLEEAIFSLDAAHIDGRSIERSERERLLAEIRTSAEDVRGTFSLKAVGPGAASES